MAALGVAVSLEERGEIERLLDDLGDEAGEMILRKPVLQIGREKEALLRVVAGEDRRMLVLGRHATGEQLAPDLCTPVHQRESHQFNRGARP